MEYNPTNSALPGSCPMNDATYEARVPEHQDPFSVETLGSQ